MPNRMYAALRERKDARPVRWAALAIRPAAWLLLAAATAAVPVRAQETVTGPYVGAALESSFDSNVTRVSSGSGVIASWIDRATLTAGYDHTYEQQHVLASADVGRQIMVAEPLYDITSQNLRLGAQLHLPLNVGFDFDGQRGVQLANPADFVTVQRDVITTDNLNGWLRVPLETQWRAVVGGGVGRVRNSNGLESPTDLDMSQGFAGLRYQTGSDNYVDFLGRAAHARYPQGSAVELDLTSYRDEGGDVRAKWRFSGSSELQGRAGYLQRHYDVVSYRNFAGPAYELSYIWTPRTKMRLTLFVLRVTGEPGDNDYLSAVTHTYRIVPAYQLSPRLRVEATAQWSQVDFYSDLTLLQLGLLPSATGRVDTVQQYGLMAAWKPWSWMELRALVQHEQRRSNIASWDYVDFVSSLSARLRF